MHLVAGQQYGRYEIVDDRLAEGLSGPVYHAIINHDDGHREEVALKFLTNKLPQVRQYFMNEERLLKKAEHPHVIGFVHSNVRDEPYTLATTFVYAYSNKELSKQKSETIALQIAEQIGSALDYLHIAHPDSPVIHRDVKPDNILVDKASHDAILIDLSVASHERFALVDERGFGTPPYMAPEQYTGHEVPATDQYALALVVYYFLTGDTIPTIKPPKIKGLESDDPQIYQAALATWNTGYRQQLAAQSERIRKNLAKHPTAIEVFLKATAFEPADRYSSCAAFSMAMHEALRNDGAAFAAPSMPMSNSRRSTMISIGAISALVLIAVLFLFFGGDDTPVPSGKATPDQAALPPTLTLPEAASTVTGGFPTVTIEVIPTSTLPPIVEPTAASSREVTLTQAYILRAQPGDGSANALQSGQALTGQKFRVINETPSTISGDRRKWFNVQRISDGETGWLPETVLQ
ncbi:serine/threonine protein kinase [Herpetosiphon giganteus]|uniref:serine/threonine protein kinase n=1 Tax=Herpetosiphon giganteus TaxID=2029754 RepID=UPI00195BBE20|nr:serine/threonine-protein kinase [Herpetosiphon giganteus]MBM7842894.1 serine/threonine protein kinase [Herpetosiphon giganteus]